VVPKLTLIVHVAVSVGWFGAVVGFAVLAVLGLRGGSDPDGRALYVAMEALGWYAIVPLSAATLATGIVQSVATPWGLVRHYWVLAKLLITVGASLLLLLHMRLMSTVADAAISGSVEFEHLRDSRLQLLGDAAAGAFVLLVAIVLSVLKPDGRTPFGRLTRSRLRDAPPVRTPMFYAFWATIALLAAAIVLRHVTGRIPMH